MDALSGAIPTMDWSSNDLEGQWKSFVQHVNFTFSGPLKKKSEEEKCAYLMIWVGQKGREIYSTWNLSEEDRKSLKEHLDRFEAYVKPRTNLIYNRYKFHSRFQTEGETLDQFVTDLKLLVKECNYQEADNMVRDRLVIGIQNTKIREKLVNVGSDLTLEKAQEIARLHEMSTAQAKTMSHASGEDSKVNFIKKSQKRYDEKQTKRKPNFGKRKPKKQGDYQKPCTRCGYKHGDGKDSCPAIGKICGLCNKPNHFQKVCKTKSTVHAVDNEYYSDEGDEYYAGSIEMESHVNSLDHEQLEWTETILVNDKPIQFQLDTGAMCNIMPLNLLRTINKHIELRNTRNTLKSYSGHKIIPKGVTTLMCQVNDRKQNVEFLIVDLDAKPIVGAKAYEMLNLVQRIPVHKVHEEQPKKMTVKGEDSRAIPEDIVKKYDDVFKGLGCMPGEHSIKVDPNIQPVIHPPRKVPLALKEKVKRELDRMERDGVVIRQDEPTPWVNSMVTVTKANGKVRICIDPRDLNRAILREHFPLKTIEDVIAEIDGATVFTKLDATSGFWQICLDADSSKLCTFNTPFGRYSFTRLPFGIKSASEVYQRKISEIVQGIDGCEAIIDDILIWGRNMQEHDQRLHIVMEKIRKHNLKLNPEKCEFRKSRVTVPTLDTS